MLQMLRRTMLFLAIGVVLSTAVTIGFAVAQPQSRFEATALPPEAMPFPDVPANTVICLHLRYGCLGFCHEEYWYIEMPETPHSFMMRRRPASPDEVKEGIREFAAEFNLEWENGEFEATELMSWAEHSADSGAIWVGYPFRALQGTVMREIEGESIIYVRSTNSNLHSVDVPYDGRQADITIPTGIIWTGALGNAIVFAIPVAMLIFLAGRLRRSVRTRRGLCATCKYPIGSSPRCSECGEPVPTRCVRSTLQ